jgi:hypothetical protein
VWLYSPSRSVVVGGREMTKAGRDRIGNDHLGERISERPFQPVSNFYPYPSFVGSDEQKHAIVLGLLTELPDAKQLA